MGREYDFSAHISSLSIGQTLDSAYGVKPKKDGQSCPFDLSYAEGRVAKHPNKKRRGKEPQKGIQTSSFRLR